MYADSGLGDGVADHVAFSWRGTGLTLTALLAPMNNVPRSLKSCVMLARP